MKHDDLWNDTLDDALPPGLSTTTLEAMRAESRRRRRRRSAARVAAGAAALLLWLGWLAVPSVPLPPAPRAAMTTSEPPGKVRYLSDEDLVSRLNEAGVGIAIAGSGQEKRLLLVSHDGGIYQP